MVFVLTLLAFCAATAYISAPFWSRRDTPVTMLTEAADAVTAPATLPLAERRHRVEVEAEVEILIARTRRARLRARQNTAAAQNEILPAWQCAECGRGMGQNDRFCASCGTARPA